MIVLSEGPSSFDDALIGGLDTKAGYTRTVTFKQKAARRVGSELAS
jgi:predicted nucleic-acid-binding protein